MRGSSLNFKPSKKGSLEHNDRTEESEVEYLLSDELRLENEFDFSAVEAKKNIKNLLVEANNNHLQTVGQELQARSYLWEAVINLDAHHTLKDLKKLVRKLEKLTGFTSVQSSIHRDEGHEGKDKDGNHIVIYNYHAHVTFFTLDRKKGLQLYRKDISKPLRREYREKVEEYRIVHKRLIPPYHSNNIIKLKKKAKWSEVNMLEINKEIRRRFKSDGHIVYDKERLSFLQTIVAEELEMPRGTVSVEAEAKRLGVVLDLEPSVRREHKQLRAQKRVEEKIEKKLTEENRISEQAHIETKIDLQNNFDYFTSLFFVLANENESIMKQLDDLQKKLVEQSRIIPKEDEVTINKKLYEEIVKIQDKFSHLDSEGLCKKILTREDDYVEEISILKIKINELNENVYSEHGQNINGKSTGKKLTNKEWASILENDTAKQKKEIEELENASLKSEAQYKEKVESKDKEILSLNQQVQELKDKKPEIIEVIKEVSIELTPEEIMQLVIETEDGSMKIEDVIEKQKEQIHKLTVPTGYEIEGESVSEKLYEYMEEKRHVLNYKSSRVESLEEKLAFQKERVVARDNLMKNQQDRYEQIVKENNENIEVKDSKIESLGQQIEALEKDVFSETWTRKDAKGEKQRSKNINVVKQLEKKREELKDIIETLNLLAYTETEYPIEFDENDKPVKFEKETWKEKAEYAEDQVKNLTLETDWQSGKISELEDLAYHDEQIYNSEIADFDYITTTYKDENKILEKELDEAKEIIETIRDYNVPISQLGEFWDEIKVTVLGTSWEKRDESSENETQQDTIKLKHGKKKIGEDQDSFPTPGR